MRMRDLIDTVKSDQGVSLLTEDAEMKREELLARYPGIEADLVAVDEWMRGPVSYRFVTEPMDRFATRAQSLLDTYPKFPRERIRTNRIVKSIRNGAIPWPIFLDTADDFIMEGRHRIVAFYILKMPTVPVVYVSTPAPDPGAPFQ